MEIIRTSSEMQKRALELRAAGKKIVLVPTMGFLHAGHASLIDIARREGGVVAVSIFVNPTQFGPNEDLDKYPRDFKHDCELCAEHGADIVFAPEPAEIYSPGHSTWVVEEKLSKGLCGRTRPIHFRGVATVVTKLFNLTQATVAVFGRKDAQQALIIKRMVRDLNMPVRIVVAPLVRDADKVALSSRNRYLSESERIAARSISRALLAAEPTLRPETAADAVATVRAAIEAAGGKIDYVEALSADTLDPVTAGSRSILLAVAAWFGPTRLIDNVLVEF
ncbi:MAG: pantoate--beta-alanine ligase [Victivallaceae bacterium]|nr:pantoate--beta-alanine ligase [Victivallaceae bacterium]